MADNAIRITAKPRAGFRRCGIHHPSEAVDHYLIKFTQADLDRLMADPNLVCELIEIPGPVAETPVSEKVEETPVFDDAKDVAGNDSTPTQRDTRISAIKDAISALNTENTDNFTGGGKPKVEAIEALTGWDLSAGERDEAWAVIQAAADSDPNKTE